MEDTLCSDLDRIARACLVEAKRGATRSRDTHRTHICRDFGESIADGLRGSMGRLGVVRGTNMLRCGARVKALLLRALSPGVTIPRHDGRGCIAHVFPPPTLGSPHLPATAQLAHR